MVVVFLLIMCLTVNCYADYSNLIPDKSSRRPVYPEQDNITLCVLKIMRQYFFDVKKLTHINLNDDGDDFLDDIHSWMTVAVAVRTLAVKFQRINTAYMIVAENEKIFSRALLLKKDKFWNPYARFLIIIYHLEYKHLKNIFDILLNLRVNNAIVINGTQTAELYAYNPFENYACGNYYTRIIEYGRCHNVSEDLYPLKEKTGLEKCHLRVSLPHWPPFAMDASRVKRNLKKVGVEQAVFHMLSEVEKFNYTFSFDYNPELFSLIKDDLTINGPLIMLQNNHTDVMIGGLYLTAIRAKTFYYLHGHLDYEDEIKIIVKRAEEIPPWVDVYFQFPLTIWGLIISIFILYCVIITVLLKAKDKGRIVLVLLDNLLAHGPQIKSRPVVNMVFIIWVWFSYLVSCIYTSTLVSHTTKPSLGYQITDEEGILQHRLRPCIWNAVHGFMYGEAVLSPDFENQSRECYLLRNSLRIVSHTFGTYGMIPQTALNYHKYQFFSKYGRAPFYELRTPYSKLIYGIYFYQGFPVQQKFRISMLRIKESGLVNKILKDIYLAKQLTYSFQKKQFESRMAIPWHLYAIGIAVSTLTLVVEIISQHKRREPEIEQAYQSYISVMHNNFIKQ